MNQGMGPLLELGCHCALPDREIEVQEGWGVPGFFPSWGSPAFWVPWSQVPSSLSLLPGNLEASDVSTPRHSASALQG